MEFVHTYTEALNLVSTLDGDYGIVPFTAIMVKNNKVWIERGFKVFPK